MVMRMTVIDSYRHMHNINSRVAPVVDQTISRTTTTRTHRREDGVMLIRHHRRVVELYLDLERDLEGEILE